MQETSFENSLLQRLTAMSPDAVVTMGRELCAALSKDADSCHGAIWPGNVYFDDDGKAHLGEPSDLPVSAMSADQVEYLAPEVFWNNLRSPAADVYSLGMLMYTACQKGRLPFLNKDDSELERAKALRRRMKGESIPAASGVSEELAAVLAKAMAHEPSERYANAEELLQALSETQEALPAEAPAPELSEEEAAVAAALGAGILSDEMVDAHAARAATEQKKQYTVRKDIESGTARRAAAQKKRRSTTIILVAGVVVVLALIGVAVAALGNLGGEELQTLSPTLPPVATATPEPTAEPTPSPTPAPTVNPVVYTAFATEDTWSELTAAELDGGAGLRLAPITSEAEMDAAITAAKAKNLKNLWLGAQYLDEDAAPNGEAGWYWTSGILLAEDDPFWAEGQPGENPEGKKLMLCYVEPEADAEETEEQELWKFFAVDEDDTDDYEALGYLLTGRVTATPKPAATPSPQPSATARPQVTPNYEYTPVQTAQPTTAPTVTTAPTATVAPTATAAPTPTATVSPSPTATPKYSVTYMADGVQVGEVQTIEHGKDAVPPAVPEKTGYTGAWAADGKNITSNLIINAVYTAKTYEVKYVADGTVIATQTIEYGKNTTAPAVPAKEGYTGVWSSDGTNITADTTITAVYTFNTSYTAQTTTASWTALTTGDNAINLATPSTAAELSELIKALESYNSANPSAPIQQVWLGAEYRADSDTTDGDNSGWYWTDSENTRLAADDSNWATGEGSKTAGKLMLVYVEDTATPANSTWKFYAVDDTADDLSTTYPKLGYVTESALSSGSGSGGSDSLGSETLTGSSQAAADGEADFFDESLLKPVGSP